MRTKHKRLEDVFHSIDIRGPDDCWNYTGYYNEKRRMPEWKFKGKTLCPYRIVYELTNGPIPDGLFILHSCDNRRCCNGKHHSLGTVEKNNAEANERERHGLPGTVVRAIRKLLRDGEGGNKLTHQQIADRYGVSRSTITAINTYTNHKDGTTDVDVSSGEGGTRSSASMGNGTSPDGTGCIPDTLRDEPTTETKGDGNEQEPCDPDRK